jgi:hypothetical protein
MGIGAGALVLALGLVACGDDDDDDDADGGSADAEEVAAFCEPFFDLQATVDESPEEGPEAETYLDDEIRPAFEEFESEAPDEIDDAVGTLAGVIEDSDDLEAFFGAFEEGEAADALADIQLAVADGCGYEKIEIDAIDYAYTGMPADLEPGKYAIIMTNETKKDEFHEIGIVRPTDQSMSLDELLALSEEESEDAAEFVNGAFAAPGGKGVAFVELEEGTYYYACFVPVGSGEDGPPHFTEGMKGELEVG